MKVGIYFMFAGNTLNELVYEFCEFRLIYFKNETPLKSNQKFSIKRYKYIS